ncbi:hypothetical protein SAMN06269117_11427 [Balnearium lithotrophicum]|uniref:Uncharacterized protein n=1 Tax=Balnearium lithotrophicum TaxID=223788 RepID=A0A521CNR6_9BACT|nr:hypothetical protein [Balnearium lithotrophicum]SMO61093.1 hypothetical protein SAMN06269117_11427 [Balnearium lithotrophicum]
MASIYEIADIWENIRKKGAFELTEDDIAELDLFLFCWKEVVKEPN